MPGGAALSPAALAPLTTLRLGGPARALVEVEREDELVATVRELDRAGEPLLILAGGSNVVIADAGFAGTGRARAHPRHRAEDGVGSRSPSRPASRGTYVVERTVER